MARDIYDHDSLTHYRGLSTSIGEAPLVVTLALQGDTSAHTYPYIGYNALSLPLHPRGRLVLCLNARSFFYIRFFYIRSRIFLVLSQMANIILMKRERSHFKMQ